MNVNEVKNIAIGLVGENLVDTVNFDFSDWVSEFGTGTISLVLKRATDTQPYPVTLTVSGTTATWNVTVTDTQDKGYGIGQLVYIVGEQVKKSTIFRFFVGESITGTPNPPDPYDEWLQSVLEASAEAQLAVEHYPKIENGYWYVWDTENEEWSNTGIAAQGEDGYSPSASVSKVGHTATISITDENGTTTAEIEDGTDGEDGFSPSASVSKSGHTATVTVTDKNGTTSVEIEDGEDGEPGVTPDFSIGTVTTGQAGSQASATLTGTPEEPVLNLTIPKGDKGDPGNPGTSGNAEIAHAYDATATYDVGDYVLYNDHLYRCTTAITTAEAWTAGHWTQIVLGDDVSDLNDALNLKMDEPSTAGTSGQVLTSDGNGGASWQDAQGGGGSVTVDSALSASSENPVQNKVITGALNMMTSAQRYGVIGLSKSSPALTRILDAVGMTAQVGTDGNNSNIVNDFDNVIPFNRRKCVGTWSKVNDRAGFTVNAYLGDDDYAEDGTMGDYVAVECPRAYYYIDANKLIVSAQQYPGYRPFDIFCHNHNVEDTIPYYYAPAYALVVKNGHAVSLPGYDNEQGSYKSLVDTARTYGDGSLGNLAILEPAAYNFYEWALFTVEFATLNCQSIMQGCAGLRSNNNDLVTFKDSTHILFNNYQAAIVAEEYICICPSNLDNHNVLYKATHKIVSIIRSDANGDASSSGSYMYAEVQDLGKGYWTYDTTTEYRIGARGYRTGDCEAVSTPSGSPISNSDSYHPMKYRYRENVYSNQYSTLMDLFNQRVGTGDSDYHLDWFYLPDPSVYEPSTTSKPDATELSGDDFIKLDINTSHDNYVNGYIKTKQYSEDYPDIWIPGLTVGGGASTFFCDHAYLVSSYAVRAVRLGGYWSYGSNAGFSAAYASHAPSDAYATSGGALFFVQ